MPQPDTLAVVDFAENAPLRWSQRDFLTGVAARRSIGEPCICTNEAIKQKTRLTI
jgi:hypothetical protein